MDSDFDTPSRASSPDIELLAEYQNLMTTSFLSHLAKQLSQAETDPDAIIHDDMNAIKPMTKAEKQNAKKKRRKEKERMEKTQLNLVLTVNDLNTGAFYKKIIWWWLTSHFA